MATQEVRYSIVSGPSREELFDGLRFRHEGRLVPFRFVTSTKEMVNLRCRINSIEVEDGSGNNWNLMLSYQGEYAEGLDEATLKTFFSTKDRRGTAEVTGGRLSFNG